MDVVLIKPEIPQNTGSIARSCAATCTPLHLVGKLGFEITEKRVRRAGLDYWPFVDLHRHPTWEEYLALRTPHTVWCLSARGSIPYTDASFGPNDALVFGSETKGLGSEFLQHHDPTRILKIPIACPGVRSLNLSNAVSIVLFEALRQIEVKKSSAVAAR